HRDSLPLRQGRIPWGSERIAVLPVEIVVPDGEARSVLFEVCAEPVGSEEKFLSPFKIAALTEKVVVAQAVLRDGDRVVLHADTSVIVKQRNAVWIVSTRIVGLLGEQHVVFAEFAGGRMRIRCWSLVPEGEVALPTEKVGAEDASIVAETRQERSIAQLILRQLQAQGLTGYSDVVQSSDSTAIVVTAR